MPKYDNAMEVFKLLDKSNCRKCNEQTCLAFASKVFLGVKPLEQCPAISKEVLEQNKDKKERKSSVEGARETEIIHMKNELKEWDLSQTAQRVGGDVSNGKLILRLFGKQFSIDQTGNMSSDIHINSWIEWVVLSYMIKCKGVPLAEKWASFRELNGGREKHGLFAQKPEKTLKKLADKYSNLFEDLIIIFNGKRVENHYDSDISLILYPFPKIPLLICYWKAEDGLESDLNIFFDSSADMNATVDLIFDMTAGIASMFEKISLTHGMTN